MFFKTDDGGRITIEQPNPNGDIVVYISRPNENFYHSYDTVQIAHINRSEILELLKSARLEERSAPCKLTVCG